MRRPRCFSSSAAGSRRQQTRLHQHAFAHFSAGTGRTQRLDQDAPPQVLAIFHSSKHASRKYRRDSQARPTCCPQVLAGFRSMAKTLPSILAEFRDNSLPQCTGQRIENLQWIALTGGCGHAGSTKRLPNLTTLSSMYACTYARSMYFI